MKYFLKILSDKRIQATLFALLLIIAIWYGAPFVAIAGHYFLASTEQRLIAILILAFLWGLNNLRLSHSVQRPVPLRSRFTQLDSEWQDLPAQAEMQALQLSFKNALKQIKPIKKRIFERVSLPAYIVLGTTTAGKTTLLKQLMTSTSEPKVNEKYYQWWATDQALLIDYFENQALAKLETDANLIWQCFLKLLNSYRKRLPLRGVIFNISCQQLLYQDLKTFAPQKFSQRLQHLAGLFPQIPVYIVLTQCDQVVGFSEFFADLTQEERAQVLALNFALPRPSHSLADVFSAQFDGLIKRLNERVLWRLQQERNQTKRPDIKDFPLQLEALKMPLAELVNQLGNIAGLKVDTCYFTSCLQEGAPVNYLTEPLETAFALKVQAATTGRKIISSKTYFVNDLLPTILNQASAISSLVPAKARVRTTAFGIAVAICVMSSGIFYLNYRDNLTAVNALQTALQEAAQHPQDSRSPYANLHELNALYTALHQMHAWAAPLIALKSSANSSLIITAEKTYQKLLVTQFLPALKTNVEQQLQTNTQNPSQLYGALKIYIMLSDLSHRDPKMVQQWFTNYWQNVLPQPTDQRDQLLLQLQTIMQQQLVISANSVVINNARTALQQIPLAQLSYSVLLNDYSQSLSLFSNQTVLAFTNQYKIPVAYSKANLASFYNKQIAAVCAEVVNGNWVLGQSATDKNAIPLPQLIQQVQSLYLQNYAQAWQQLLTKITFNNLNNISQVALAAQNAGSEYSPLWQLLYALEENTNNASIPEFNTVVSNQFSTIDDFMVSAQAKHLQHNLANLTAYLTPIAQASDTNKAAWSAAAERMDNNGTDDALGKLFQQVPNLPQPIQGWMNNLAVASWHILLGDAQSYLNNLWGTTVLSTYNQTIANKYPLFKNANADISLRDFSEFFSTHSVMNKFFNTSLRPFIDTSHFYWVWKNVNNQQLAIPQTTLEMFMRYYLIQKMYFASGSSDPMVKFTLSPLAIEPGVRDFSLDLDGQAVNYQGNRNAAITLTWPGPVPDRAVMQFVSAQGERSVATEGGPWAWFKLLDKAKVQAVPGNPRQFKLVFDLNGNSVAYELHADNLVNPFISGIVDAFRCPETL